MVAALVMGTASTGPTEPPSRPAADRDLARKILQDERMDEVVDMGHELLKSGMNAGSGYSEVWIRDLNTFIVPLLDVAPRKSVREALLVFFHFQGEDGNIVDGYVPKEKGHAGYKYPLHGEQARPQGAQEHGRDRPGKLAGAGGVPVCPEDGRHAPSSTRSSATSRFAGAWRWPWSIR